MFMALRYNTWICLPVLAMLVTGCANTRLSHEPGLVTAWDGGSFPAMEQPPEISLILHTRYLSFGQPSDSPVGKWWSKKKVRKQLEDVMGEFPFLGEAQWDAKDTSYRLVIEATHAIRGSKFHSGLSSTTKYIIPVSEKGFVELEAWLYRDAQLLETYEAVGSYKMKRHLLFLLVPWMWGTRVPSNTMEDTFRDLFLQIQEDATALFSVG